jgi:hypothetical protein
VPGNVRVWIVWIKGHKIDFLGVSVEPHTVAFSYLFAGPVFEPQQGHEINPRRSIKTSSMTVVAMLRQSLQTHDSRPSSHSVPL